MVLKRRFWYGKRKRILARVDLNTIDYAQYDKSAEGSTEWFAAPAAQALGDQIRVAVFAENIVAQDHAASIAVHTIHDHFLSHATEDVKAAISDALTAANTSVLGSKPPESSDRRGASVCIAVLASDRLFVGGVGNAHAYIIRDDNIHSISPVRSWVRQAEESWQLSIGEIQDSDSDPSEYVGKDEDITVDFAPVEFIWSGDHILFLSARLASRLPREQIRDIAVMNPPDQAAAKLIDAADARDDPDLKAIIMRIPGPPVPLAKPALRMPRPLKGLVAFNAALLLLIAALLLRSGGLQGVFAPASTVEVARPMFIPTAVIPTPGSDVPDDLVVPTPDRPAAAPTVTPLPTFTPIPTPPGWRPPPNPPLLQPANATTFNGLDAPVILSWGTTAGMLEDMFYVVDIRRFVNGRLAGESLNWTKSTRIRLDSSFYTAMDSDPRAVGALAPQFQQGQIVGFEWSVSVYRLTSINPDGTLTGTPVSQFSPPRTFFWGPAVQQAPTRVYGSQSFDSDPFFQAQAARENSSRPLLTSASAGMAGFWIVLGVLASIPKAKSIIRRYLRRALRF